MPQPVSEITTSKELLSSECLAATVSVPPAAIASEALLKRFNRTCWICLKSHRNLGVSGSICFTSFMPLIFRSWAIRTSALSIISSILQGCIEIFDWRENARRFFTISPHRAISVSMVFRYREISSSLLGVNLLLSISFIINRIYVRTAASGLFIS